jgi:hypothetical protein
VFGANFSQWHALWIFFLAGLAFSGARAFRHGTWILPALVLLINAGYFLVLHATPHDLKFQVETALLRLMLHSGVLALVFAFEALIAPSDAPDKFSRNLLLSNGLR